MLTQSRPTTPKQHKQRSNQRIFVYPTNYQGPSSARYGYDGTVESLNRLDGVKLPSRQRSTSLGTNEDANSCATALNASTTQTLFQPRKQTVDNFAAFQDLSGDNNQALPHVENAIRKSKSSKSLRSTAPTARYSIFPSPSHSPTSASTHRRSKASGDSLPPIPPLVLPALPMDFANSCAYQRTIDSQTSGNRPSTAHPTLEAAFAASAPSERRISFATDQNGPYEPTRPKDKGRTFLERYSERDPASQEIPKKDKSKSWEVPGVLKMNGGRKEDSAKHRSAPPFGSATSTATKPFKSEFSDDSDEEQEVDKGKWVGNVVKKVKRGLQNSGTGRKRSASGGQSLR
jgi:hypothetical protein